VEKPFMPHTHDMPNAIRPLSPTSRIREVELRIREYITGNDLAPGARLPGESWFASELQVGRPLIREAMKGLEAVGMIEARRGVGRFVSSFDPEAYLSNYTTEMLLHSFSEQELNETRCLLEISMATDATKRLTDKDIEHIQALLARMQAAAATDTIDVEADLDLHRTIMRRSENRLIVAMLDAVYALAVRRRAGEVLPNSHDNIQQDMAEHAAIVRAAEARDGQAVRTALVNHFRTTATRLGFEQRWHDVFSQHVVEVNT
jgi:GntR family transcriptional repressor for pyruvate dehydrogenase complex